MYFDSLLDDLKRSFDEILKDSDFIKESESAGEEKSATSSSEASVDGDYIEEVQQEIESLSGALSSIAADQDSVRQAIKDSVTNEEEQIRKEEEKIAEAAAESERLKVLASLEKIKNEQLNAAIKITEKVEFEQSKPLDLTKNDLIL